MRLDLQYPCLHPTFITPALNEVFVARQEHARSSRTRTRDAEVVAAFWEDLALESLMTMNSFIDERALHDKFERLSRLMPGDSIFQAEQNGGLAGVVDREGVLFRIRVLWLVFTGEVNEAKERVKERAVRLNRQEEARTPFAEVNGESSAIGKKEKAQVDSNGEEGKKKRKRSQPKGIGEAKPPEGLTVKRQKAEPSSAIKTEQKEERMNGSRSVEQTSSSDRRSEKKTRKSIAKPEAALPHAVKTSPGPAVGLDLPSTPPPASVSRRYEFSSPAPSLLPQAGTPGIKSSTFAKVLRLVARLPSASTRPRAVRGPRPAVRPPVWAEASLNLSMIGMLIGSPLGTSSRRSQPRGYHLPAQVLPRLRIPQAGHLGAGGQCVKTREGKVVLQADQSPSDARVATLLQAAAKRTPIVLLVGEGYALLPWKLESAYAVLGWYWISVTWVEAEFVADGSGQHPRPWFERVKIRFDWVQSQGVPWWEREGEDGVESLENELGDHGPSAAKPPYLAQEVPKEAEGVIGEAGIGESETANDYFPTPASSKISQAVLLDPLTAHGLLSPPITPPESVQEPPKPRRYPGDRLLVAPDEPPTVEDARVFLYSLQNTGQLLAQHFAVNSGVKYKYSVDTRSVPLGESPSCVVRALNVISTIVHDVIGPGADFNEILSVLYRDGQKMNWHDDGEEGEHSIFLQGEKMQSLQQRLELASVKATNGWTDMSLGEIETKLPPTPLRKRKSVLTLNTMASPPAAARASTSQIPYEPPSPSRPWQLIDVLWQPLPPPSRFPQSPASPNKRSRMEDEDQPFRPSPKYPSQPHHRRASSSAMAFLQADPRPSSPGHSDLKKKRSKSHSHRDRGTTIQDVDAAKALTYMLGSSSPRTERQSPAVASSALLPSHSLPLPTSHNRQPRPRAHSTHSPERPFHRPPPAESSERGEDDKTAAELMMYLAHSPSPMKKFPSVDAPRPSLGGAARVLFPDGEKSPTADLFGSKVHHHSNLALAPPLTAHDDGEIPAATVLP
ncbi:hypothetical protein P7C73_g3236, partial [Tremellales sp. Uapishka_1]